MFAVVRRHAPGRSILRLLDAMIFNVLICNTDAHAKNYALLLQGRDRAELAPLYDLLCAAAWDGITQNLAQEIGGGNRGDQLTAKHWRRLAAEAGTSPAGRSRASGAWRRRSGGWSRRRWRRCAPCPRATMHCSRSSPRRSPRVADGCVRTSRWGRREELADIRRVASWHKGGTIAAMLLIHMAQ